MLHNIEPHKYCCEFSPRAPIFEQDYLLVYSGEQILLKQQGELMLLPRPCDMPDAEQREQQLRYLFSIDDTAFFTLDAAYDTNGDYTSIVKENADEAWLYTPVRNLREYEPSWLAFAAITGHHLHFWYAHNRYCGACGAEFMHSDNERALLCPCCGYLKYPEIAVAVIVGVSNGENLLLVKHAVGAYRRQALIAGFAEIGESLEDTVRREVFEEVGLRVKNLRYFASQPWGFSRSLLAGFYAEVDGSTEITLDGKELAEAAWVKREDIEADPKKISLTATMMLAFKERQEYTC